MKPLFRMRVFPPAAKRGTIVGSVVLAAVVGAIALAVLTRAGENAETVQEEARKPVPSASLTFLAGPGRLLMDMQATSRPLWESPAPVALRLCEEVAVTLNSMVRDSALVNVASEVPDDMLRQLFLGLQAAVVNGLAACGMGNNDEATNEFTAAERSSELIQSRLKDLGG